VRHIEHPVTPYLEMARLVHALDEELTVFESVPGWVGRAVAGVCSRRRYLALALGVAEGDLLSTMVRALRAP